MGRSSRREGQGLARCELCQWGQVGAQLYARLQGLSHFLWICFSLLNINYLSIKDQLYLYDLKTGKELKKFDTEIGTVLQINGEKKDDFVIKHKCY